MKKKYDCPDIKIALSAPNNPITMSVGQYDNFGNDEW